MSKNRCPRTLCKNKRAKYSHVAGANCCSDWRNVLVCCCR